jgi:LysM repeat protein
MKRLACALVLAGSAVTFLGVTSDATAATKRAADKLLLSILTPDPGSISDRLSLDVSYRGGTVETVELYLDNALVAQRRINAAQTRGIISFSLDTALLAAGSHDVMVKAYGPDGKPSVTQGRIKLPAADLSAPVRIAYPSNGTQVSGIVPVRVTLDSDLIKLKPYVTFFVDKELKVLRNYPPYEYNWDTTKASNGWHLLEAWTTTEDSIAPTKARPVNVNVNNGGGETKKQSSIEDLREPLKKPIDLTIGNAARSAAPKAAAHVDPSTAISTATSVNPGVSGRDAKVGSIQAPAVNGSGRDTEPSALGLGHTSAAKVDPRSETSAKPVAQLGPKMAGGAAVEPSGRMVIASRPKSLLPAIPDTTAIVPVVAKSHDGGSTTVVKPRETLTDVSNRTGVSGEEIARLNNMKNGASIHPGAKLVVPRTGSFDVAFNGSPIIFDVAPRIENGMKLAPFRQIFEHTGGRLYWFGGTAQTVRAVNDAKEIEIKIGNEKAKVNNQTLKMERKPFIDSGRTIVPLTFVRDALGVKINFDDKTGRLLIESK